MKLPKENPGEHFDNLDMLTELLSKPKTGKARTVPGAGIEECPGQVRHAVALRVCMCACVCMCVGRRAHVCMYVSPDHPSNWASYCTAWTYPCV